jgi:hypothetical protein
MEDLGRKEEILKPINNEQFEKEHRQITVKLQPILLYYYPLSIIYYLSSFCMTI